MQVIYQTLRHELHFLNIFTRSLVLTPQLIDLKIHLPVGFFRLKRNKNIVYFFISYFFGKIFLLVSKYLSL